MHSWFRLGPVSRLVVNRAGGCQGLRGISVDRPNNSRRRTKTRTKKKPSAGGKIELVYFDKDSRETNALLVTREFLRQALAPA